MLAKLARGYYGLYGLLTLIGGIIGYATAGSLTSLLVGALSGIILMLAAYLRPISPTRTDIALLLTGGGLLWFFIPRYLASGAFMPAGLMSVLSGVAMLLLVAEFIERRSTPNPS